MTPLWPRRRNDRDGHGPTPAGHDGGTAGDGGRRGEEARQVVVEAGHGGTAVGRDVWFSATAPGSHVTVNLPAAPEVSWPVEVGRIPAPASAFQPRTALRERLGRARAEAGAVAPTQVLTGGGGVGKTQLAAACAVEDLRDGADLVVWCPAGEVQQIVTGYQEAALRVRAPGATGDDPQADARALLSWLATTPRRWLVVLDDLTDPEAVRDWWPASRTGSGWVLATTRLRDARLTGGGRTTVDVGAYEPDEAAAFLRDRLSAAAPQLLDEAAAELAGAVGRLPLALGLAATHMINEDLGCTRYLDRFSRLKLGQALPPWADAEAYGREITAALLLSLEAAQNTEPAGLAVPVLRLAALLDPAGHPHRLWETRTALLHLSVHGDPPARGRRRKRRKPRTRPVTAEEARAALRVLHRYALLTCDSLAEPRGVRIHALTARAIRETTPEEVRYWCVRTAADALLEIWPEPDRPADGLPGGPAVRPADGVAVDPADGLAAVLRANTAALARHGESVLWGPHGNHRHLVLFRAGLSLLDDGLTDAAVAFWRHLTVTAERVLGSDAPDTLTARHNLAAAQAGAGHSGEAAEALERVAADRERLLGPDHLHTLATRDVLGTAYRDAGRTDEAVDLLEHVLADRERLLGPDHPHTLATRNNLATAYLRAGRHTEAVAMLERLLDDMARVLPPDHRDTLTIRANLATAYDETGRTDEALELRQRVLTGRERLLGPDHPDTLAVRNTLAGAYRRAGRTDEAVALARQILDLMERLLGPDHPHTRSARRTLQEWRDRT